MALHSAIVPFILESIKSDCSAVMFPDLTGNVYLMGAIPAFMQNAEAREKYFLENDVTPDFTFVIKDDGMLAPEFKVISQKSSKAAEKFSKSIATKYGIPYLVSAGYITVPMALSLAATTTYLGKSPKIEGYTPSDAVQEVVSVYQSVVDRNYKDMMACFELADEEEAYAITPGKPVNLLQSTLDDRKTVTETKKAKEANKAA